MGKTGAVILALIAILLLLGAAKVSLGSTIDTWLIPVLVAIWAIVKVKSNFFK